ncbi:MAG: hypothetical protein D6690_01775 [Nitrospirae bacterium]|nr:MAG: hypothetical protein D6690_01775 [Nitrospirota bacterium]
MAAEPLVIEVLADMARELHRQGMDSALAGGLAYNALVEPRATTDLDVLMLLPHPSPVALREVFSSFFEAVLPYDSPMTFTSVSIWRSVAIRAQREIMLDCLLAETEFLQHVLSRKRVVDFLGMALPIVTVEGLILLKTLAGRLQDLADLENIRRAPHVHIDWSYVEYWARRLGLPASSP